MQTRKPRTKPAMAASELARLGEVNWRTARKFLRGERVHPKLARQLLAVLANLQGAR